MKRGPKGKSALELSPLEATVEHAAIAYLLFSLAAPQWASVSIALAVLLVSLLAT